MVLRLRLAVPTGLATIFTLDVDAGFVLRHCGPSHPGARDRCRGGARPEWTNASAGRWHFCEFIPKTTLNPCDPEFEGSPLVFVGKELYFSG